MIDKFSGIILALFAIVACTGTEADADLQTSNQASAKLVASRPFAVAEIATFNEPWAMAFIPGTPFALITEKSGKIKYWEEGGAVVDVAGVPAVKYAGQGGLGDVVLHPDFAQNGLIYLSYAEAGEGDVAGAAVARARLDTSGEAPVLKDLTVIWRQSPKVTGAGHYGHRIAFGPDGMLYIASGERQKFDPAQDMQTNLGKVLRLTPDGKPAPGNPFAAQGGVAAEIWSLGHRNPLGLAFDGAGRLWDIEMGPRGGDELNLVLSGKNYGYPLVSNGDHYDGRDIPDHPTRPEFEAPKLWWTPVISPSSLIFYSGKMFPEWRGNGFATGLSSQSLVRITIKGDDAKEAERWDLGHRIRQVVEREDGALWILEDGPGGRLLRLTPAEK